MRLPSAVAAILTVVLAVVGRDETVIQPPLWTAPAEDPHVRRLEASGRLLTVTQTINVVRNDYWSAPATVDVYFEEAGESKLVFVYFPGTHGNRGSAMPALRNGMRVQLSGAVEAEGAVAEGLRKELSAPEGTAASIASTTVADSRPIFVAQQISEVQSNIVNNDAESSGNAPDVLTSLIVLVNPCGFGTLSITKAQVESAMFDTSNADTWAATHASCSRGASTISGKVIGPITVCPAVAKNLGQTWQSVKEVLMADYAADYAAYKYKTLIQPDDAQSSIGSGQLGGPISWIRASYYADATMQLHEVGHNLYLHHAGNSDGTAEYDDKSSAMGYCCARRCYHFIHSWQLGFATVSRTLESWELRTMETTAGMIDLDVPELASEVSSGVILPSSTSGHDFVISYRGDSGFDSFLSSRYQNQVYVHMYDGMLSKTEAKVSRLLATVSEGDTVSIPYSSYKITWHATASGIAKVRLNSSAPAPGPPAPLTPAPPPAATWTSYFSEEQGAGEITSGAMVGIGCKGDFCDQVRTAHSQVIRVDLAKRKSILSTKDTEDLSCGKGEVISRLTCKESECGRIEIECAPVLAGILKVTAVSSTTVWVPKELHGTDDDQCPEGSLMTGILCGGTRCAKKQITCQKFDRTKCTAAASCISLGLQCGRDGCGNDCGACGDQQTCLSGSGRCVALQIKSDWCSSSKDMPVTGLSAIELKCQGRYCAEVRLGLMGVKVDFAREFYSCWISDNKGKRWAWNSKTDDTMADCPDGQVVTSLECRGHFCDDLRMQCAPPIGWVLDTLGEPWHGKEWFSEENGGNQACPTGFALTGLECQKSKFWCFKRCGDYCDNKKIRCRQILPLAMGTANTGIAGAQEIASAQEPSTVCDETCRLSSMSIGAIAGAVTQSAFFALALSVVHLFLA